MRRRSLLLAALASLACAALAPAAGRPPVFSNCGSLVTRPASIVVTCADANYQLRSLRWSSWGGPAATATGTALVNDCTPYCAAGHVHAYPVRVVLSRPTTCRTAVRYLRLAVTFTGKRPQGLAATDVSTRTCTY